MGRQENGFKKGTSLSYSAFPFFPFSIFPSYTQAAISVVGCGGGSLTEETRREVGVVRRAQI